MTTRCRRRPDVIDNIADTDNKRKMEITNHTSLSHKQKTCICQRAIEDATTCCNALTIRLRRNTHPLLHLRLETFSKFAFSQGTERRVYGV